MEKHWYIISEGKQVGPVSVNALKDYGLNHDSLVWTPGMSDWQRAGKCPELSSELADISVGSSNNPDRTRINDTRQVEEVVIEDTPGSGPQSQYADGRYGQPSNAYYGEERQRIPDPKNPGNWLNSGPQGYTGNGPYQNQGYGFQGQPVGQGSGKSNIVAGLLAIFLGYLGVQYFYIGKVGGGLLTILLFLVTCGAWSIVTLIQGIYMLTLNEWQFDQKYVYNTTTMPIF